ncbi:hypothetical protein [Symbiobacterium thermophilum]|uniref:Uncharacterized protein n=1 Tax=Symbiobacterium thermophilum TaxID=2734 RepID=A0A953I8A2_SYMTR|nr:hypothetical protein [Symbiobacterium thermophilum]MBY6275411.1 hypothetical protein [Symbiobacterium thermophilum]
MSMPMPTGGPVRLPAQVAGSMSRMQGLLQAAQPEIQSAYASHWLAARQAAGRPYFQDLSQHMMMGLYGTTALGGLLRYALSGRATPEVVGGIIDQVQLIRQSYEGAQQALERFLEDEEVRSLSGVQLMSRTLPHLDRFYQQMEQPGQAVLNGIEWQPSEEVQGWPVRRAEVGGPARGWQPPLPRWESPGELDRTGDVSELPPPEAEA